MRNFKIFKRILPSLGPIIFRNVFLLVNVVIFLVVILLFVFGSTQAALFLGLVFVFNTLIAIIQDVQARVILERLQMLTALSIVRINKDQTETSVLAESILKGDLLKLKLGDQVPCEGILISADNLEISEALVTGESDSFPKRSGDKIIAGAIIISGSGVMEAQGLFHESSLSVLASDVKKYAAHPSSIQTAANTVIKYSGYILVAVLLFVISRGLLLHIPKLEMVNNSGALASTLVPQGLMVVITLLFAIGAASYSKRHVLFQEINATEKIGRIKNLCIDKTGTLTDNILVVEDMHILPGFTESDARAITYGCIQSLGDSSQIILAVKKYLEKTNLPGGEKIDRVSSLPFSSWRRFGAVGMRFEGREETVFIGSADIMLPRISDSEEKKWLEKATVENARAGKRVLCVARASGVESPKDLSGIQLSVVAIFIFKNTLREGIEKAIKFFQDRGVRIRVLSGDNADTVRAVAQSVGVIGADKVVTGEEMSQWSDTDFNKHAHEYTVFAQVLPEHKVKLVEAFKKDGFTAMVGDGVNDALAMKKSDLGIAMFEGVPVTRQLAGVILMTNSFSDLPGAVELSDHFIRSLEITAGIYINHSLVGLLFFIIMSSFGYPYPLLPLSITFINYFTVGFSGLLIAYWAVRPSGRILPANDKPFLNRVMPLVFACSIIEAIGVSLVFYLSPAYLKSAPANVLVGLAFIAFSYIFLLLASKVYCITLTRKEKIQLFLLGIFELIVLYVALQIPLIIKFFSITLPLPAPIFIYKALMVFIVFGLIQYFIVRKFFFKKNSAIIHL